MGEEHEIRASDSEREQVVERLREAGAEARLTLGELVERSEAAYGARTRAELDALTRDLPVPFSPYERAQPQAAADVSPRRPKRWMVAVMGGGSRRGRWRPAEALNFVGIMGGATLDLRGAEVSGSEITITSVTVMGGLEVIVPEGVEVELDGFQLMGGTDQRLADVPRQPGTPTVRIRAFALMGGVNVRSKPPDPQDDASPNAENAREDRRRTREDRRRSRAAIRHPPPPPPPPPPR